MKFTACPLAGAYIVEPEPHEDHRGSFARVWCRQEFAAHGLDDRLVQCNTSWNRHNGTLRGMHYQTLPGAETKLVRCLRGALLDVIVDLRPKSPTFMRWHGVELSQSDPRMLYIPMGFAHGFMTLADDTEILYFMSDYHAPTLARGFRWNDPRIGIQWPLTPHMLSDRDAAYPDLQVAELAAFESLGAGS